MEDLREFLNETNNKMRKCLSEGMSNSDVAYDIVDAVLRDLKIKDEKEQDKRFKEIAKEVIKRLKKQGIKDVDEYDVSEMLGEERLTEAKNVKLKKGDTYLLKNKGLPNNAIGVYQSSYMNKEVGVEMHTFQAVDKNGKKITGNIYSVPMDSIVKEYVTEARISKEEANYAQVMIAGYPKEDKYGVQLKLSKNDDKGYSKDNESLYFTLESGVSLDKAMDVRDTFKNVKPSTKDKVSGQEVFTFKVDLKDALVKAKNLKMK